MILTIQLTIVCVITSICYQILIQRGELLQIWARFVNISNMPAILKKLFLCAHCVAGQLSLYSSILIYINSGAVTFVAVPFCIVLVYFFNLKMFIND
jgi:hypothetical protein